MVVNYVVFQKQLDRLAKKVIKEHRKINYDNPTDEIVLEVYRSIEDFEKGKTWTEYLFLIEDQAVRLVPGDF